MTTKRWSVQRANQWYDAQPWFVGCNFTPSSASNQLEMWQEDTFDLDTIGRELGWAADIGMNSVRVFLHDLVWDADPVGMAARMDRFLAVASSVGIRTMLVLFDDCWFPAKIGPQPEPIPGVHNSRWAQSPGHAVVGDRTQWPRLERYVKDVIGVFARDERVCVWDLYNEPGNALLPVASMPNWKRFPLAIAKVVRHFALTSPTLPLLRATFEWARQVDPIQPLTAGVWAPTRKMQAFQLEASDVITFHQYMKVEKLKDKIVELRSAHGRPVLCTEWMARPIGSRFESHLPVFRDEKVGCYCWGLVSGKTQTIHGWEDRPGSPPPEVWHHDVLRVDGTAFDPAEIEVLRDATRRRTGLTRATRVADQSTSASVGMTRTLRCAGVTSPQRRVRRYSSTATKGSSALRQCPVAGPDIW
jgi:hypothetical protein